MTRYNEIMERVEVTPEMRHRVLANATEAAAKSVKRRSPWKQYVLVAACLALVLLGSLTIPKLLNNAEPGTQQTDALAQGGWNAGEYDSAEALSAAAGYAVRDVPALVDAAAEKTYTLIGGDLAQITYTIGDQAFTYRVSPGSGDNSGDFNEYSSVKTVAIGGVTMTLKGDEISCRLALWEADGFSHSLSCGAGISYADMEAHVISILQS